MKKWLIKQEWSRTDEDGESVMSDETQQGGRETIAPHPDGGDASPEPEEEEEEADVVEGGARKEECHNNRVSAAARKRFAELFQPEVKPRRAPQVLAGVTVAATHLGVGCALGVSGVMLPHLTHPAPGEQLFKDSFYAALFENLVVLGAAVGSVVTGPPQVWIGQRLTLLLALPLALAAWVVLATSYSVWVLIAARVVQGLTLGFIVGPSSNYLVELAHTRMRGILFAFFNTFEQLGYLVVYAAGHWGVSWRLAVLACGCVTTVVPFVGLIFLPDSPRWLASKDRLPEALKSLIFFRGAQYDNREELAGVLEQLNKRKISARDQLRAMENPDVLYHMLMFTFLVLASQFAGGFVVSVYTLQIFNYTKGELNPSLSAVLVSAVRAMGAVFHMIIVELLSRKFLLVCAFLLCAGAMALLGSSLYDQAHASDLPLQTWLPLASLATFTFFSNSGLSVLFLLREEILPSSVRSTAIGFLSCLTYVGIFVANQTYLPIVAAFGQHGVFWLFCCFNFLLAVVGGLSLRETRGLTLEEVSAKGQPEENLAPKTTNPESQSNGKSTHTAHTSNHSEIRLSNGHLKPSPPLIIRHGDVRSPPDFVEEEEEEEEEDFPPPPPPCDSQAYASITDGCVKVYFVNQE